MENQTVTILIGNPGKALHLIASSRASAKTPDDRILYPAFEILAEDEVVVSAKDIDRVTVVSTGLSAEEELLIMEGLAKYCGTTGASARKYLSEKINSSTGNAVDSDMDMEVIAEKYGAFVKKQAPAIRKALGVEEK